MANEKSKLASIAHLPSEDEPMSQEKSVSFLGKRTREDDDQLEPQSSIDHIDPNNQDGQEEISASYDPMELVCSESNDEINKRFKTSEDDEVSLDDPTPVVQLAPSMVELNNTNSIKLKKGNLVVRKLKHVEDELHDLQNKHGYEVIEPHKDIKKSVKYQPDTSLEAVKFFK